MASVSEFRRQHSRVWWSSFHADEQLVAALGSPIPAAAAATASPALGPLQDAPATPAAGEPGAGAQEQGSRDSSSSPSTSHKSQDSGFSDSDGSHRANASPLSSSPEVTEAAQLASTPSPTHSRLQLCLSGACTSTPRPRHAPQGPASFGGLATPGELRSRLSQDDSCIQSRPLPAIPVEYRRQHSAEEPQQRLQRRARTCRALLSRTAAAPAALLDSSLEEDTPATLNQTFPLPGPPESGHRVPRSFIKNRAAPRRPQQRYSRLVLLTAPAAPDAASPPAADAESTVSDAPTPHHTTVLHVRRTTPDGEAASPTTEMAVLGQLADDAEVQRHLFDVTAGPGLPAHTSTPKAAAASPLVMPPPATTTPMNAL